MRSVLLLLLIPMVLANQCWSLLSHAHDFSVSGTPNHNVRPHFHVPGSVHRHHHGHGHSHAHGHGRSHLTAKGKDKASRVAIVAGQDHDADAIYCASAEPIRVGSAKERLNTAHALTFQFWTLLKPADNREPAWDIARLCDPPPNRYGKCRIFLRTLSIRC